LTFLLESIYYANGCHTIGTPVFSIPGLLQGASVHLPGRKSDFVRSAPACEHSDSSFCKCGRRDDYHSYQGQINTTSVQPGTYTLYGKISDGVRTRYLYAPEPVTIVSSRQPNLGISKVSGAQFAIAIDGVSGQTIVIQLSTDLKTWVPTATNTLTTASWNYTNNPPSNMASQFYRALLLP
jgi:hypothetical protein